MVTEILDRLIPKPKKHYRHTLPAQCRENEFIEIMEQMPKEVECSSLPKLHRDSGWQVSISVASEDERLAKEAFAHYIDHLENRKISYTLDDDL
jgi:hypothetical protein